MNLVSRLAAGLLLSPAVMTPQSASANAFVAWKVAGVPDGDVLNVRKFPANSSRKRGAYPDGTQLSMTGRCTGGVNLRDIEGQPAKKQMRLVRGQWCEVWHDPARDGNYETGWVYGKFIAPAY